MGPAYARGSVRATGRPIGLGLIAGAALVSAFTFARAEDAPPQAAPLTGAAAWSRVVGNTISGTTPDGPYLEFFGADGSFAIVDSDGKAGGHWSLRDDRLCTLEEDEGEECRAITVTGNAGAFIDAAGRYPFEILPGNPKGL